MNVNLVNVNLDECQTGLSFEIYYGFERQTENESKVSSASLSDIFMYMNVNLNVNLGECHTGLSFEFCCDLTIKLNMNLR